MRVAMIGCTDRMFRSNNMTTVLKVLERIDKFVYKYDNMKHE